MYFFPLLSFFFRGLSGVTCPTKSDLNIFPTVRVLVFLFILITITFDLYSSFLPGSKPDGCLPSTSGSNFSIFLFQIVIKSLPYLIYTHLTRSQCLTLTTTSPTRLYHDHYSHLKSYVLFFSLSGRNPKRVIPRKYYV